MILTTVPSKNANDWDADRNELCLASHDPQVLDNWVREALRLSYERLDPEGRFGMVGRAFMFAWRHVMTVKLKEIDHVIRELAVKMSVDTFLGLFLEVYKTDAPKEITVHQFIRIMTRFAINGAVGAVLQFGGVESRGQDVALNKEDCALVLGRPLREVVNMFEDSAAETCDEAMLLRLLFGADNSVLDPAKLADPHDMTQPLNRYLISSSHNTYLEGDQLQSRSRADMYRIVLQRGCRCVEIDMWDGDDGSPIVKHGRSMTPSESLENVLVVIRDHSFTHGLVYPVILSVENHLSRDQQRKAAKLIEDILGDMLVAMGPEERKSEFLPSPESLKGKILIKAKTGSSARKTLLGQYYPAGSSGSFDDSGEEDSEGSPSKIADIAAQSQTSSELDGSDVNSTQPDGKVDPEFAKLVFLAGSNRKALMELWKQNDSGVDHFIASSCVSVNEKKLQDLLEKNCGKEVRIYNAHAFSRVYPKGRRVDSSNYCPLLAHYLGCQLVALNWQSCDYAMSLNHARFLANGGCGYVLSSTIRQRTKPCVLLISIISAFLLPKIPSSVRSETPDPYCTLKVYDSVFQIDEKCCSFECTTDVVKSNGLAPSWSNNFTVPIQNPSLAMINFKVYDRDRTSDDDVIGHKAVPVSYLRSGFRSISLNGKNESSMGIPGTKLGPALLCNIAWRHCE